MNEFQTIFAFSKIAIFGIFKLFFPYCAIIFGFSQQIKKKMAQWLKASEFLIPESR